MWSHTSASRRAAATPPGVKCKTVLDGTTQHFVLVPEPLQNAPGLQIWFKFCFSVWNDVCHDVCCHALCVVDLEEVVDMLEDLGCKSAWYRMLRSIYLWCMVHYGTVCHCLTTSHNCSQSAWELALGCPIACECFLLFLIYYIQWYTYIIYIHMSHVTCYVIWYIMTYIYIILVIHIYIYKSYHVCFCS